MADRQKILVTGANGQLGMEIRDLSPQFPQFQFVFVSREELAIDDFSALKEFFERQSPQYCINCAAYTKVDAAESHKEEAFLINGEAVSVIADCCRQNKTKLIHVSTDYVFNGDGTEPYTEDAQTDPVSVYGASKLAGEHYAMEMNPETIIIRTSWVYSSYGNNFVKTMRRLMKERAEINVVNDQVGSPTYAADLAEVILKVISEFGPESDRQRASDFPGIYHFSNDGVISWYEFALAIKELTGSQCQVHPIPTSKYPTPAKRPMYSVLDKKKIQETFDIKLKDWKESLAVCVQKLDSVNNEQGTRKVE
jgi:dTDP-4-dehydrorhamnose reductase